MDPLLPSSSSPAGAGAGAGDSGDLSAAGGPARRSLRRWARPAPYSPSPRRFLSSRLSQPSLTGYEGDRIGNEESEIGEISEIEQHLKNRTFTREEADRLIGVLQSRTPALHDNETISAKAPHFLNNAESTLTKSLLKNTSWKPGDSVYSKTQATGSTPIEIAKAYMKSIGSSTPNTDYSQNRRLSILKNQSENSAAKSPIHWPGAVLQDKNILETPKSNEGNKSMIFSNTPSRTPYPDSHFSRSSFKVKNDRDSYDVFSTGKKRRFAPLEGSSSKKPNTLFREESENTPKPSFERREYSFNDSIPAHIRKSSEKADKILKFLERPVSTPSPFKKTFLQESKIQENKIQEKESGKEKKNWELGSSSVLFSNQKQEINKDSKLKSASKPPLNAAQTGTNPSKSVQINKGSELKPPLNAAKTLNPNPTTGGFSFSFPVPTNKFHEPPPTPTMPSSPSLTVPAELTFRFGSASSNRLVFSFGNESESNWKSDETVPIFKFGSDQKRDLDFGLGVKDAVCC